MSHIILSLVAVMSLSAGIAHADVCQKDDIKLRIRVVKDPDGTIAFLQGTGKNETFVGPNATFTREELDKMRWDAQHIIDHVSINDTGNGIMALFAALAIASDPNGRAIAANHPGPDFPSDSENRAKVPHAKEIVDALAYSKIDPSKECRAFVDSIEAYKTELAGALSETYGQRFKEASVAADKQADGADSKYVHVDAEKLVKTRSEQPKQTAVR